MNLGAFHNLKPIIHSHFINFKKFIKHYRVHYKFTKENTLVKSTRKEQMRTPFDFRKILQEKPISIKYYENSFSIMFALQRTNLELPKV